MTEAELTILRAAANIAHADALALVLNATTDEERECVSRGLLAHLAVVKYLAARDDLDRPF